MLNIFQCFAVCAPGLESFTERELHDLGCAGTASPGGVQFHAGLPDVYQANLWLRTASRVLVRLGTFHASAFSELRQKAARLEWGRFLRAGQPVTFSHLPQIQAVSLRRRGRARGRGDCRPARPAAENRQRQRRG